MSKKLNYFLKVIEVKVEEKFTVTQKIMKRDAKEMLLDVDYKAATTRKRIRRKVPNDGDTPEVF